MNPVPLLASGAVAGPRFGIENLAGAPALGMFSRNLSAAQATGKALLEGEPVPESAARTFDRSFPGVNLWMMRLFDRSVEGFEEDEDR